MTKLKARTLPQWPFFFSFCLPRPSPLSWQAGIRAMTAALTMLCSSPLLAGNDFWHEKVTMDALLDKLNPREVVELGVQPVPSLALYRETSRAAMEGAAIILHPPGKHLDSPGLIQDLRLQLTDYGWSTLSLQMPEAGPEQPMASLEQQLAESSARLRSAVNFLNQKGIQNVVIIGEGISASLAVGFVTQAALANQTVQALVTISWPHYTGTAEWLDASRQLEQLKLPLLDIYAEHDKPEVLGNLRQRLNAAHLAGQLHEKPLTLERSRKVQTLARQKTGNLRYRQTKVSGAHPFFTGQSDTLVKIIRGWIKNYAAGIEATIE